MNIKERSICRSEIERLIEKFNCSLETFWKTRYLSLSDGLRKQVKKMIIEKGNPENLSLTMKDYSENVKEHILCGNCKDGEVFEGRKLELSSLDGLVWNASYEIYVCDECFDDIFLEIYNIMKKYKCEREC